MRVAAWIVGVASLLVQPVAAAPAAMAHPLDPLSNDEIAAVVAVLERAGRVDPATRFALIDLDEPDKAAVLAWRAGESVPRRAAVVARRGRRVYEGVVDLGRRQVERWHAVRHVQSRVLGEEWERAQKITKADAQWQAAMRSRGYEPTTAKVFCAPLTAGYFADSTEEGRRLLKVTCFDTTGTRDVWSRPIEGLVAVVDLDANRVVRLLDRGAVPVAPAPEHFEEGAHSAPAPAPATAPGQPRVSIDGNTVSWGRWSFHYRLDARSGLVVSLVRYDDRGRQRLVLYRGSLAEMFVPYMDPDPAWSFRTYFDVGEWGFGTASSLLVPGRDCPADARFLDAVLADAQGHAIEHHQVICVFERNTGAPLWRHAEIANGDYQGRLAVELVVRTIASLGDYDYVIDWVLTEAGAIRIDVGATGIDQVKGVRAQSMADPTARTDSAYGPLVAPHLVGVHHDHFLSFRLDVDIDGPQNTLVRRRLARQRLGGVHSRRSLWRPVDQPVTIEGPLSPDNFHNAVSWRIENPNLRNALGQHPAYELRADTATSLLAPDDFPQRRAAFSASPLWVTAYDPRQLYAAGRYPNQSPGGGGLPTYTAARRSVANTDIVLWYTMGFHHIPRPEDWPVMPTMWYGLTLVPDGFFDRNPAFAAPRGGGGAAR